MIFTNTLMLVGSLFHLASSAKQYWGVTGQDHCKTRWELSQGWKKGFACAFHTRNRTFKQRLPSRIPPRVFSWLIVCCNWMFSIDLMTTVRDRINAHLPIVLEVLRTGSLVVIALSTICASQSLKQMAGGHDAPSEVSATHKGHD
ncbi:hypothetical protein PMIT1313_00044 [Prochlorococcus marinus str. MIT 1313]|nr:hypothetical protein PMIT1313_00044 [Prochlorococcus marinus str. MIT 1313]KZR75218.1 hypothetical protein PMIT1318_00303 [Prochlorococcus marinus str. MIT 1318]